MNEAEPAAPGTGTNDRWQLDGRITLVTGASAGLGARFARVLHAAGAQVIATARRADRLDELARQCGNRIQVIVGDIADPQHRQALTEMLRPYSKLDSRGSEPTRYRLILLLSDPGLAVDDEVSSPRRPLVPAVERHVKTVP